ncbi:MAG: L,D-transpeptidase [Opitutales bacterium]
MQNCRALSTAPGAQWLIVSIADQRMALIRENQLVRQFVISTSKNPPSCLEDSLGTPTGLHRIEDKIGSDQPEGMVFKGRQPTGRLFSEYCGAEAQRNLITSRILRLRGLEAGKNSGPACDSYDRYIYIHGTNHEARIGSPFSGGCIELRNREIIELFEIVDSGDLVWIAGD